MWLPALRGFGILQMSFLSGMLVLHGAGVGGGSLGYANVQNFVRGVCQQDADAFNALDFTPENLPERVEIFRGIWQLDGSNEAEV